MKFLDLPDFLTPEIDATSFRFIVNNSLLSQSSPWVQIPNWHQQINVTIKFEADFKLMKILEDSGLTQESKISCGLTATSSKTKLKTVSKLVAVSPSLTSVEFDVDGHSVGGDLRIEAFLTVQESRPKAEFTETAPREWAIIWSQQTMCHLEGNQARAEIHPADFSQTNHKKALWKIHEDFPLERDSWITCEINNAINVEYNDKQGSFIADPLGIQLLASAYAEAILDAAVTTDGVLEVMFDSGLPADSRGSLLRTAHALINGVIGSESPDVIRSSWNRSRQLYVTKIQHMTGGKT